MNFGFNFGMLGSGGGIVSNACLDIGTDGGTTYGFKSGSFGTITPTQTITGELYYEVTWNTATGDFILSFGVEGNTKLDGVSQIQVINPSGTKGKACVWDEVTTVYVYNDMDEVAGLPTTGETCMGIFFLPDLFIHYDFATIMTGDKT